MKLAKDKEIILIDILSNENLSKVVIATNKDVSSLIKNLENSDIEEVSILPSISKMVDKHSDIFVVMDDIEISEVHIGTIKNLISTKIIIFTKSINMTDDVMFKMGLQKELSGKENSYRCYSYNLDTYNNKRSWNNPDGWANPENFNKFRW
ncbi:MAG: DUF6231 family protein [Gammaproteobacteria bacterium]|jgi:hypothetical protein